MVQELKEVTAADKQVNKFKLKYTPYYMIFAFASMTAMLRLYLMPEWGWMHVPLFLYQCIVFSLFWQLISFLNRRMDKVYPFERGPLMRMFLQNVVTVLSVLPWVLVSYALAKTHLPHFASKELQAVMVLMFFVVLFMFNFAFFSLNFFSNWQKTVKDKASLAVQAAQLEQEKSELQYHQLKNQVNPHYLFNMLTSLDGLVHSNPDLASDFIRHMSKVYRYVLQHKESEVVNVEEELEFINHYIELLQIRYGKGLNIHVAVSPGAQERGVVMITLQMMIDNAIKHNIVQESSPLKIIIWDQEDYLVVHNNKQLRKQMETSNGTGLEQLKHLYTFHTAKSIEIEDMNDHYTIKIPLL